MTEIILTRAKRLLFEELKLGDIFVIDDLVFIKTTDLYNSCDSISKGYCYNSICLDGAILYRIDSDKCVELVKSIRVDI